MPKVSDEHKEARRAEILAAAQRVFARHGYEGATVARLEGETGLSRGAIFSYFESKDDLFVAVVAQSSDRLVEIWLERGFRALLQAILEEDSDWLAVEIESTRRIRTNPAFKAQIERLSGDAAQRRATRGARLRPAVRSDLPLDQVAAFLALVANGLAFARIAGDDLPELDVLAELVETGVAPR